MIQDNDTTTVQITVRHESSCNILPAISFNFSTLSVNLCQVQKKGEKKVVDLLLQNSALSHISEF